MKEGGVIVLYPAPGLGHMVSMTELAKLILHQCPRNHLSITILVPSFDTAPISAYITTVSQAITNLLPISFLSLPTVDQDSSSAVFDFLRLNIPNVISAIQTISDTSTPPLALITSVIVNLSYHPEIPTYYYFTSGSSALATILYFPTLHAQTNEKSFKDLAATDTEFHIPGVPTLKTYQLPQPMLLDQDHPAYSHFFNFGASLLSSKGIIINTFDALEPAAIKAITQGACFPQAATSLPPLYCIGPLIADAKDRAGASYDSGCLSWLDEQPSGSVIFLSFGSKGALSMAQIREIAVGLEASNQRFLWVVRTPLPEPSNAEKDLEALLPEGFQGRTKGRGLVVKSWAPQADILARDSVGGFVTHCGWNSVVEAVGQGVPMVAWPLYAEQHLNAVVLVEEVKLAMAMDKRILGSSSSSNHDRETTSSLVSAEVVEERVKELMSSGMGRALRERCQEMRVAAMDAWAVNGSSRAALCNMLGSWKEKRGHHHHADI